MLDLNTSNVKLTLDEMKLQTHIHIIVPINRINEPDVMPEGMHPRLVVVVVLVMLAMCALELVKHVGHMFISSMHVLLHWVHSHSEFTVARSWIVSTRCEASQKVPHRRQPVKLLL